MTPPDPPHAVSGLRAAPVATGARASIAVLPFTGTGLPPSHAFLPDALTDDLINDLGRIPGLAVIGRSTMFTFRGRPVDARRVGAELGVRYVVEGSVRFGDAQIRLNVQLVDATTGVQRWADRIDASLGHWPGIADRVGGRLARSLDFRLADLATADPDRPGSAAGDLAMRGWLALFAQAQTRASNDAAFLFAERALALEADHALALTARAYAHYRAAVFGWSTYDMRAGLALARDDAARAIACDPDGADAHYVMGQTLNWLGELDGALAMHAACLQRNPSHAPAHGAIGQLRLFLGHPEATAEHVRTALLLSPMEPLRAVWHWCDGFAELALDRPAAALEHCRRSVLANPRYPNGYFTGAVAAARVGETALAREWVGILGGHPRFASVAELRARFANIPAGRVASLLEACCREIAALGHPVTTVAIDTGTSATRPAAEVRCLGGFDVLVDGRSIRAGAKIPRRPLALLQLLVAAGGRIALRGAAEALWPDVDPARAAGTLATTVHRLRKLLPNGAVLTAGDELRIDVDRVAVDALAFTRLASDTTTEWTTAAVERYAGVFLPDVDEPWAEAARERLRALQQRVRCSVGGALETRGAWDEARTLYEAGIALDPLAEAFHQGALRCCEQAGLRAEAAAVYERCRRALAEDLGVRPSARTESLYRRIASA